MASFVDKIIWGTMMGLWLKRFAIFALIALPFAVIGFRLNLFGFPVAYKILGASLLLSAVVFLLTSLVTLTQHAVDAGAFREAQYALYISLIPLLFLGMQIFTAKSLPMIHNISTDVNNPPQFNEVLKLRNESDNSLYYDTAVLAKIQKQAYPGIETFVTTESHEIVFKKASAVVAMLGWGLVNKNTQSGIIEATETSGLWGFNDDVVIRIKEDGDKVLIDVRSVSRIGKSDLGANAKRIKRFFDEYKVL